MIWLRRVSLLFDLVFGSALLVTGGQTVLGLVHLDGNIYHGLVLLALAVVVMKLRFLQDRPIVRLIVPETDATNGTKKIAR